ncbi:MAG: response regulator [Cyanobacteria bacterium J06638_38]
MIRTVIVDDENLIRQTLQIYFESEPDIEIVGTGDSGQSAIALVETLNPDVVLIDIEMPEMDGLTATEVLRQRFPETKVIVLSSHDESAYVNQALALGAAGYLLKSLSPQELSESIQLVHQGYLQIAPGLSHKLSLSKPSLENSVPSEIAKVEDIKLENGNTIAVRSQNYPEIGYSYDSLPQELDSLPTVEPDDFLPAVSIWTTRGAMILLGIFSAALLLANVLEYKTTVKAMAKIRPRGELRTVQTTIAGKIIEIKIEANQTVKQGDVIATVDDAALQTQVSQTRQKLSANQAQLKQTKAQIVDLDRQIAAETTALAKIINSSQADLTLNQQEYQQQNTTVEAELTAADAKVKLAREELTRYQQLAETGAVSQLQISEKQAVLQESIARQTQAQAAIMPSNARVIKAEEQIAREQAQGEAKISALNLESKNLIEKRIRLLREIKSDRLQLKQLQQDIQQTTIRATASGIIQQMNLRNSGQVINAGDEIATIVPNNSDLMVVANVAAQDIGNIQVNQNVQIKVDPCPYPDYGVLSGVVKTISPDAFVSESQDLYRVNIKPEKSFVGTNKHQCAIASGMNGNANIVTKQESVISFLLRKARLKLGT